ncbi:MAG: hypothetical protein H0T42_21900 [Deltaproteobacteria bacterium]|nr:hypothetical protein [Deltaproteobacteria bacterium]
MRLRRAWWLANRDKAPSLFADELRHVVSKLRKNTDVTRQRYSSHGAATVWRLLMPKTRHHLYYQRDERTNTTTVLLVANAVALAGPDL